MTNNNYQTRKTRQTYEMLQALEDETPEEREKTEEKPTWDNLFK